MKLILDNIIFGKSNNGGISNYWGEIIAYFINHSEFNLTMIDCENEYNYHRNNLLKKEYTSKVISSVKPGIIQRVKPIFYSSTEPFIYHSSFYRNLLGAKNKIEVTTIHDFTHDYFFPYHKKKLHNYFKYSSIQRSKGIICVSKNTYKDLKEKCGTNFAKKIEVIYNGVNPEFRNVNLELSSGYQFIVENNLETPFLLFVGSRAGYKNFNFVLELLKTLPNYNLCVVGSSLSKQEKTNIPQEILNRIIELNNVDDIQLNWIYNKAVALLYPSSYEGFGIPIIEAMRAGCPVISMNNSSIAEIAPSGAVLLENLDISEFNKAIEKIENTDFRQELISEGFLQSQKYSWEKCCSETELFYKEVFNTFS
jgi:glycosyltransferase involved in cell wall biosynthesis